MKISARVWTLRRNSTQYTLTESKIFFVSDSTNHYPLNSHAVEQILITTILNLTTKDKT
jgi:hypothetical protein